MSRFQNTSIQVEPIWAAATMAVVTLISMWPYIPATFIFMLLISGLVMGSLMTWFENPWARLVICLIPTGIFLANHGLPGVFGWFVVGTMTFIAYAKASVDYTDTKRRAEFFDE
jgi:hypothetical protein